MARSGKTDSDEILEVLEKISKVNRAVAKPNKLPSLAGNLLGSNVSLVRNVAVPPIIVFNCLLLF